jgi:outer membrane lipoprotein carrier protein
MHARLASVATLALLGSVLLPGAGVLRAQTSAAVRQPTAASAPTPAAVLARARAEFATVRSARAEFTQELKNPLTGRAMQSRGTLLQRKPGRIAVTFTEPAGDRIVSDGTTLWVYIPSSAPGQVIRMPAGAGGTGGIDLAATVLDASREGYDLADAGARTIDGRATRGVTLTGQAGADVPFPRATVWIDEADATVREVAIVDAAGVNRVIRIVAWEKNAAVPDSAFRFTVPRGVRVVEQP